MTILKMKLKNDKIYIKVSGGEYFTIPKNGTYELDIYEGMELEYDEIPHIRMRAYEAAAKKSAVNALRRGFLSEGMLRDKLLKKGHKKRFINYAIAYCKEYELIDDKRFAKITALKKAKLKNKTIDRVSHLITEKSEVRSLKNAIRKYYKIYENKEKRNDYIIRTLMRKGFKYDSIKKLLDKYRPHKN